MPNKIELQKIAIKLIQHNTHQAAELNTVISKKEIKEDKDLSKKAQEAKFIIQNRDFGCSKCSVAELVSKILGEEIIVKDDNEEENEEFELKIPFYTLMVTLQEIDDHNDNTIDLGSFLLKINYSHNENWNSCPDPYYSMFACIDDTYQFNYDFENLKGNMIRFATDKEIITYVNKMKKEHLESWFGFLGGLL